MEKPEISRHEVAVYHTFLRAPTEWLTSAELATRAEVAPRTARLHAMRLAQLGLIDEAAVHPGHRYRLATDGHQRNPGYLNRLTTAASALGIDLDDTPHARSHRA